MIDRIIGLLVTGMDIALGWFDNVYSAYGLDFVVLIMVMVVASAVINSLVSPMLGTGSSDGASKRKKRGA